MIDLLGSLGKTIALNGTLALNKNILGKLDLTTNIYGKQDLTIAIAGTVRNDLATVMYVVNHGGTYISDSDGEQIYVE